MSGHVLTDFPSLGAAKSEPKGISCQSQGRKNDGDDACFTGPMPFERSPHFNFITISGGDEVSAYQKQNNMGIIQVPVDDVLEFVTYINPSVMPRLK